MISVTYGLGVLVDCLADGFAFPCGKVIYACEDDLVLLDFWNVMTKSHPT